MHASIARIQAAAADLQAEHEACDRLGRLTDRTVAILRESGGMQLLQARSHGGHEASPEVFLAWVREVARHNPAAGWVAGVVGVHPWELALMDPRLQDEIHGVDAGVWVASPYAPQGRARPVEGGFVFSGEWQYSTGTDHCDWVILGGIVADPDAAADAPPDVWHFILPRADYEIVPDSWQVMGLAGTGSKNVRIHEAFVPDYRTVGHAALSEGAYVHRRPGSALYRLPFGCVFSAAIASATFGIARGALDAYLAYVETRVSTGGVVGKADPYQVEALAEAEADLAAGISHVDAMIAAWMSQLEAGDDITRAQRLEFRRNQVRAVQRVLFAVDRLFSRAGSAAIWQTRPLERYWRDLRTAGTHICNVVETVYGGWASLALQTGAPVRTFH
jgi:alkylation response protein AidB-like acyl-CoA dehydrogenase